MNRIQQIIKDNLKPGQRPDYIALALEIGTSPNTLRSWRSNTTQPKITQLPKIARILGVNVNELLEDG